MRVSIAKWLLRGTDFHVHTNPGKLPETRKALNDAVAKAMEFYPPHQEEMDMEEYYERKYGRAKK